MKQVTVTVYQFDELTTEGAKENARNWYRQGMYDFEWWESIYADAESIGLAITSFDLDRNRHCKGKWTTLPDYGSANGLHAARLITANHGAHCDTFKHARVFQQEVHLLDTEAEDYEDKLDALDSEFLRTLLEEYSIMLQKEYEWMAEDAQVEDNIRANQYEFDENGKRFVVRH